MHIVGVQQRVALRGCRPSQRCHPESSLIDRFRPSWLSIHLSAIAHGLAQADCADAANGMPQIDRDNHTDNPPRMTARWATDVPGDECPGAPYRSVVEWPDRATRSHLFGVGQTCTSGAEDVSTLT